MKTTRPVFPSPPATFTSDRLLFRAIVHADAEDFHAFRTDTEVMKWTGTAKCDVDIEATRAWMARFMPPSETETFVLGIEERACPGKVIGMIGVHDNHPPEFGYIIAQSSWGQGYATEAVRAFLGIYWALERKTVDVDDGEEDEERELLRAVTDVGNKASRNVLSKCAFVLASESEGNGRPEARYYLEAPASYSDRPIE